jgi:hypothetical protein
LKRTGNQPSITRPFPDYFLFFTVRTWSGSRRELRRHVEAKAEPSPSERECGLSRYSCCRFDAFRRCFQHPLGTGLVGANRSFDCSLPHQSCCHRIDNLKSGDSATANNTSWEPATWPAEAKGFGFTEAARGALGHWVHIKDRKIANYQIVVPSTWNASPKDGKGQHGAYEAALLNTPMADPQRPIEILRTIHSFDPCLACASHVIGPDGRKLAEVVVR